MSSLFSSNNLELDNFFIKSPIQGFNLIYTNIRSMRKNFNSFLIELNSIKEKVMFIVLSEIWIGSDEINLYNIPGYTLFANCNNNYRAGGVLCYVDSSVNAQQLHIEMNTADVLLINVQLNKLYFKLFCLYRLQQKTELNFLQELELKFDNIHNDVIYIGDININLLSNNAIPQNYVSLLNNNGFLSFVNLPTRITQFSKTCIDHLFIRSKNIKNFKSCTFDLGLTDHCILGLTYSSSNLNLSIIPDSNNFSSNDKRVIDFDMVKCKLEEVNWDSIFSINDVNECYNQFSQTLTSIVLSCKKGMNVSNKLMEARKKSPWITPYILNKVKRRKTLYLILKRRPYDRVFLSFYNKFCEKLKGEIDLAKNNYYSNKLESCKNDVSRQWKIINELTGNVKSKNVDKIELDNGTTLTEPEEVAQAVNDYFISIQSEVQSNDAINVNSLPRLFTFPNSFFVSPVTVEELKCKVKSLKNKKSTGFDLFSTSLVKHIIDSIAHVLTYIINLSFSSGVFPEQLKLSIVIPIQKKSNSLKLENLRPISLLSIFSKVFEKLMKDRLLKYLENLNFFSNKQFGFTKGKSTEDALVSVTDLIYTSLNDKNKTTGVFIDFKKAFDLVDHDILLSKLEAVGVRGITLNWFKSFLVNRKQKVKIGNKFSLSSVVKTGVPQGSVSSATLFLIFINDLLNLNFRGQISAFADDIALFYSGKDPATIAEIINEDLILLNNWVKANKMQVNVSKTKFINFDFVGFELPVPLKYHINGCNFNLGLCNCEEIEKVNSYKYLGVTLDEKLSWENHVKGLHSKLRKSIRTFYYLRNFCSTPLLRTLYFALIHSKLQYGIICWGGTYKTLIDKLRSTQNYFVRIILKKNRRETSYPLYLQLKIFPIQHLFVFKVLRMFYIRSGNLGNEILFYQTRSNTNYVFRLPKVNKSLFRKSFNYLGPKLFNHLPEDIRKCNKFRIFCNMVRNWLFMIQDLSFLTLVLI